MNYEFSLNKTAVLSLIAGSLVFGFLLFIGGLVVGSFWLTTEAAVAQSAKSKNEEDDLPKEPVLNEEEAPAPKPAAPNKVDPAAAPPKESVNPAGAPAGTPAAPAAAATALATPFKDEIKILQEADPTDAVAETDPEYVTVQVGVFLDENDANRLLKQIENKGYSPSFFTGRDAEARQWFAVRIGAYSDKQQAASAAANFAKQEKMKAVVRPVGSL